MAHIRLVPLLAATFANFLVGGLFYNALFQKVCSVLL